MDAAKAVVGQPLELFALRPIRFERKRPEKGECERIPVYFISMLWSAMQLHKNVYIPLSAFTCCAEPAPFGLRFHRPWLVDSARRCRCWYCWWYCCISFASPQHVPRSPNICTTLAHAFPNEILRNRFTVQKLLPGTPHGYHWMERYFAYCRLGDRVGWPTDSMCNSVFPFRIVSGLEQFGAICCYVRIHANVRPYIRAWIFITLEQNGSARPQITRIRCVAFGQTKSNAHVRPHARAHGKTANSNWLLYYCLASVIRILWAPRNNKQINETAKHTHTE